MTDEEPVPFAHVAGPHDARTVVIGEAWGEAEERYRVPFAGASGREFARMLCDAGYDAAGTLRAASEEENDTAFLAQREEWLHSQSIMLTNVFALRPINNNLGYLCGKKEECGSSYTLPKIRNENPTFLLPRYMPHLRRLASELRYRPRNLILALGGTALWSLSGSSAIGRVRGAVGQVARCAPIAEGEMQWLPQWKMLPTYHPAAIFRAWQWRPIVLADLIKALRERETPLITRPARTIIINPTIEEVEIWTRETLSDDARYAALAPDIETMNGQIRCIGFARSASEAIVIPFIADKSGSSYWSDARDEYHAWACVRDLLASPLPKIFQNGMFDMQYLIRMGMHVVNARHDTMLLHHVMYPEMQKSLGFLGSIYTNETAWKLMRLHKGEEELKRDE